MQRTAFNSWTSSFRDLGRSRWPATLLGMCMAFLGQLRVSVFLWVLLWYYDGQVGVGHFAPPSGLGIARVSGLGGANSSGDRWLVSKREKGGWVPRWWASKPCLRGSVPASGAEAGNGLECRWAFVPCRSPGQRGCQGSEPARGSVAGPGGRPALGAGQPPAPVLCCQRVLCWSHLCKYAQSESKINLKAINIHVAAQKRTC